MVLNTNPCEYMANEYGEGEAWHRGAMLGAGSFSYVFLGIRKSNKFSKVYPSLMAIKSCDLNSSRSLKTELYALQKMGNSCPYVLKCFGSEMTCGEGSMSYNLLLEFASGGTLDEKIIKSGGGGLPESEVRSYTWSILKGLEHIHRSGYAHCDLKPENIFVEANEGGRTGFTTKIGDFGLSQKVGFEEEFEMMHKRRKMDSQPSLRGTVNYMAPEGVKYGVQGPRSDIWALGCVVLEMLTGKKAWRVDRDLNDLEVLDRIKMMGEVPTIPSEISEVAKDFIRLCLERDLTDRCGADVLLKHEFVLGFENRDESEVADRVEASNQVVLGSDNDEEDTGKQTIAQVVDAYGDDEVDAYTDDDEVVDAYGDDDEVDTYADDEVVDAQGDDEEVDLYADDDEVVDAQGDDEEVDLYADDDEVVDAHRDDEEVDAYTDDDEVVDAHRDDEEVDAYTDDDEVVDADGDDEVGVAYAHDDDDDDDDEVVDAHRDDEEVDAYTDDDEVVDAYAEDDDDEEEVDPYAYAHDELEPDANADDDGPDTYADDDEEVDPHAYVHVELEADHAKVDEEEEPYEDDEEEPGEDDEEEEPGEDDEE